MVIAVGSLVFDSGGSWDRCAANGGDCGSATRVEDETLKSLSVAGMLRLPH